MTVEVRLLTGADGAELDRVATDVFDHPVDARWSAEFLADARHHLVVAIDDGAVVGFASAVHYVHPDKPPELWINEVGVATSHQRQGIGRRVLAALLRHGTALGGVQAWVLTSPGNDATMGRYAAAGGRAEAEPSVLFDFPLHPEAA